MPGQENIPSKQNQLWYNPPQEAIYRTKLSHAASSYRFASKDLPKILNVSVDSYLSFSPPTPFCAHTWEITNSYDQEEISFVQISKFLQYYYADFTAEVDEARTG